MSLVRKVASVISRMASPIALRLVSIPVCVATILVGVLGWSQSGTADVHIEDPGQNQAASSIDEQVGVAVEYHPNLSVANLASPVRLGIGSERAKQAFHRHFVPLATSQQPSMDVLVMEYHLPMTNLNEYPPMRDHPHATLVSLKFYDPVSRASASYSSRYGEIHMTDPQGVVWRGYLGPDPTIEAVKQDEFPIDDSGIERFLPQTFVQYMLENEELLVDAGEYSLDILNDAGEKVGEEMGAYAVISLAGGSRFIERLSATSPRSDVEIVIDSLGRVVSWRHGRSTHPKRFTYAADSPEGFFLPDPAHGGNWRLVRHELIANPDVAAIFTPEFIEAKAKAWGLPEPLRRPMPITVRPTAPAPQQP